MGMTRRLQLLVPLALVVACGSQNANPAVLHLAEGGTAKSAAVAPATSGSSASSAGGDYELTGTLPSGTPDDAAAWTLSGGRSDTRALKQALHTTALDVATTAGKSWSWSPCSQDAAVSSDGAVSGCAVAVPAGSPVSAGSGSTSSGSSSSGSGSAPAPIQPSYSPPPTPPDVPEATVRKAVAPVFEALGISLDDVTFETGPYGGSGSFDPTVGGLQVVGLTTRVDVDNRGRISSASGWLGTPDEADLYPLITAKAAFDAIPIAPRMMALCPVGPDGKGCVEPQPQKVTGAHLGLLAQPLQARGTILVPAWLFEVSGAAQPVAQLAVQGKYLGAPAQEPVPPASTDPVPPTTTAVPIDAAYKGATPNEVVVQYGDSGSCPHTGVTHDVKEDATSVHVVLQADARKPMTMCTDDYHPVKVTIELQAPLGDRTVVDGSGGKPVPVG